VAAAAAALGLRHYGQGGLGLHQQQQEGQVPRRVAAATAVMVSRRQVAWGSLSLPPLLHASAALPRHPSSSSSRKWRVRGRQGRLGQQAWRLGAGRRGQQQQQRLRGVSGCCRCGSLGRRQQQVAALGLSKSSLKQAKAEWLCCLLASSTCANLALQAPWVLHVWVLLVICMTHLVRFS
jgi:hypothetical protein